MTTAGGVRDEETEGMLAVSWEQGDTSLVRSARSRGPSAGTDGQRTPVTQLLCQTCVFYMYSLGYEPCTF